MNILHIGLLSHYTEGMTYQDNIIPDINCMDGHEVTYITDIYAYENGVLIRIGEENKLLPSSLRLIRIHYDKIINSFVTKKIQKAAQLKNYLKILKPNIILYHGLCGYELMTVSHYVKNNPGTIFYVDSHEDFNNTAKTIAAKLAYKYIHGYFVRKALPYIRKILYVSSETKEYIEKMYHLQDSSLEWFPLGGIIRNEEERKESRKRLLLELDISDDSVILQHSGKLDMEKKTRELIRVFERLKDRRLHLVIYGSIPQNDINELEQMMAGDSRIHFLGWKQGEEIYQLLLACDLYCQPGSQSATMQTAMCCGCPVMIYPHPSYQEYTDGNGYFVENEEDIYNVLKYILEEPNQLERTRKILYEFSKNKLDYYRIARKIYV